MIAMDKAKLFIGALLFLSGIILFGMMHLAIAIYIPQMLNWSDPPGKFISALNGISGWVPYLLSIVLMVIGLIMILVERQKTL